MALGRKTGGRQKGTKNVASVQREQKVNASGVTPLEYLLATMRDEQIDPIIRFNAAKAAAPYVHPGLSSIDVGNKDGKPFKVIGMQGGDEEL
jgi:hypothetical protein